MGTMNVKTRSFMNSVLIIMCFFIPCFGADKKEAKAAEALVQKSQTHVRNMLIFMDTSEKEKWGAISSELIAALEQKAGIIVVPNQLLHYVLTQPTLERRAQESDIYKKLFFFFKSIQAHIKDFISDKQKTIAIINGTPTWNWQSAWEETNQARIRSLMTFNPDEWIISIIKSNYLLIPKNLAPLPATSSLNRSENSTQRELEFGLKIDHITTIDSNRFAKVIRTHTPNSPLSFIESLCQGEGTTCNSPLFVTRSEYTDKKMPVDVMPKWVFYIVGHGTIDGTMAGFNVEQFQKFLTFCDTKIVTKLFIYSTCYGAGINASNLFTDKERKEHVIKNYSFPIMSRAIPDVPAFSAKPQTGTPGELTLDDIDQEHATLRIHTLPNFNTCFTLASQEVIPYDAITRTLTPPDVRLENLMVVKPAYMEWKNLLDADNLTVSITKTIALTQQKPLALSSLVKKGAGAPQAILLYARSMPFEIAIGTMPLPRLISMIPGKVIHVIDKVSSNQTVHQFIKAITKNLPDTPKKIWIKELKDSSPLSTENFIISIINSKKYAIHYTRGDDYILLATTTDAQGNVQRKIIHLEHDYTEPFKKLLEGDSAYQQELQERANIQAIGNVQARKKMDQEPPTLAQD